jgi:hypothetical protein
MPRNLAAIKAGPSCEEAHHDRGRWNAAKSNSCGGVPMHRRGADRAAPFADNQAALPPRLLHAERKALRSLPCRSLAVA